eukprot:CAMPEP_0172313880 /NCGR_PEP_ID=MMETSP1058-20130122/21177_1 /TAXON_ID=83371 /ORGANISM="Detonula confervacea, Strain CCMP 353" /LENGTH=402 /DNA_ID=CAMNT_0013027605 /DNA_START=53 /DNA_END=1262 /DNA_ORIENTATION=+
MTSKDTQVALKKLREEVSSNKVSIKILSEIPMFMNVDGPLETKAKEQKKLGEKEMEIELMIEEERKNKVVREYEELHPPVEESCPICLEDIRIHSTASVCYYYSCCGNWTCKDCSIPQIEAGKLRSCPLCREPIMESLRVYNRSLEKCVERGQAWAQFQLGYKHQAGEVGGRVDMKKAIALNNLSAEQSHPPALSFLSGLYQKGVPGVIKKNPSKSTSLMKKAADAGDFSAQANYAAICFQGQNGKKVDCSQAAHYATLASYYNKKCHVANAILGFLFLNGNGGLGQSANLATHYLETAVKVNPNSFSGFASYNLGHALMQQCEGLYGLYIFGYSSLPRAAYWTRKARAAGDQHAKKIINNFESFEQGKCAGCQKKESVAGGSFNVAVVARYTGFAAKNVKL